MSRAAPSPIGDVHRVIANGAGERPDLAPPAGGWLGAPRDQSPLGNQLSSRIFDAMVLATRKFPLPLMCPNVWSR